jgi:hypothetical protein
MQRPAPRERSLQGAALAVAVGLAFALACGGAGTPPLSPANAGGDAGAPLGNGGAATLETAAFTGEMKGPTASGMAADLKALGLDAKALPPLAELDPGTLRKVMRTFTKSLGAQCTDCHQENDYRAPTPRKNIAAKMWDRFARELTLEDGSALYCDSCHHGRMTPLLDRHNAKALSMWMDTNYVGALKRKDGKEHGCETCHGDPFEGHFVRMWSEHPPVR